MNSSTALYSFYNTVFCLDVNLLCLKVHGRDIIHIFGLQAVSCWLMPMALYLFIDTVLPGTK